jgi:hypothetical protein
MLKLLRNERLAYSLINSCCILLSVSYLGFICNFSETVHISTKCFKSGICLIMSHIAPFMLTDQCKLCILQVFIWLYQFLSLSEIFQTESITNTLTHFITVIHAISLFCIDRKLVAITSSIKCSILAKSK